MAEQKIASILAADCGSVMTKVVLIDWVDHVYSFVARGEAISTYGPPWNDITLGISEAIAEIELATGRQLLDHAGAPIMPRFDEQEGVDAFIVVLSAAEPLHILLAGLMNDVSLETARRAIATTYSTVDHQYVLANNPSDQGVEQQIAAIHQTSSDLILLVGGIDGGADKPVIDLAHTIAIALEAMHTDARPHVIFAGNTRLRAKLAEILGGIADFKPVSNVLPTLDRPNLSGVQAELDILYLQSRVNSLPGFKTLSKWSSNRIIPTAKSFAQTIHYLGQSYNIHVLGVDVGSSSTTIAAGRKHLHSHVTRSDVGVGSSLPTFLPQTDIENFRRWLPFEIKPADLKNLLQNKGLFPQTVPQTQNELLLELAVAREALRVVAEQAGRAWPTNQRHRRKWINWDLIVGSGQALTNLPHLALSALVLLDGLEPTGIFRLSLDANCLVGMLGSIALVAPLAAAQVAGYDALLSLGTVVAPVGIGRPGEVALKFKMIYEDDRQVEAEIPFGTIEIFPLKIDEKATLEIRPTRSFSLSSSTGSRGRNIAAVVEGGALGIIVDTRGRPIMLARDEAERRRQIRDWLQKLGLPSDENETISGEDETDGS